MSSSGRTNSWYYGDDDGGTESDVDIYTFKLSSWVRPNSRKYSLLIKLPLKVKFNLNLNILREKMNEKNAVASSLIN